MSILSIRFAVFVLASFFVYFLTPKKYQWISLLVISLAFYLFAGLLAVVFILLTATSTFFAGLYLGKVNDEFDVAVQNYSGPNPKMTREEKKELKADEDRRKKRVLVLVLVLNFGILIVLKYFRPLVSMLTAVCSLVGLHYDIGIKSVLVPLGISYYTFQAMGYLIDLNRRKYAPERNYGHFLLFISFFPQLIQGPVSRYDELMPQLTAPHPYDYTRVKHGIELFAWGLFKKLVISDRIAIMVTTIFASPETYGGAYLLVGTVLSTFRLYTDFAGGIDMTRGVAEAFGVIMPENFTRPFFSINLAEYWRRWHITMNTWWRDYIFYPMTLSKSFQSVGKKTKNVLGANFSKKLPILMAVIVIRLINAIWHGFSGPDVVGGLYHGLLLAISFYFEQHFARLTEKLRIKTDCLSWRLFQYTRTFVLVAAPKIVTSAGSLKRGAYCIKSLFTTFNPWVLFDGSLSQLGVSLPQLRVVSIGFLALLVVSTLQEKGYCVRDELDKQNVVFRGLIYVVFLFAIVLFGVYGSGYDAGAFIYQMI